MRVILSLVLAVAMPSVERGQWADLSSVASLGVRLNRTELDHLRRGHVVVKVLEPQRTSEIAVFVGSRIAVGPERFFEALQQSAKLWRGPKVPRTGSFSSALRFADVDTMQLPGEDLDALRHCRPGDCDVKLTGSEMERVRAAIDRSGSQWRQATQAAFKSVVLDRIRAYRGYGLAGLEPFHDHESAVAPHLAFSQIAAGSQLSAGAVVTVVEYLSSYPRALSDARAEHMYWLEVIDAPKPTIQASHVVIERLQDGGAIEVAAAARQIFATHYVNASLSVTVLVRTRTGERFMLYLNRSSVDGLSGLLADLKRFFVHRRVRHAAHAAFEHLKRRIESFPTTP